MGGMQNATTVRTAEEEAAKADPAAAQKSEDDVSKTSWLISQSLTNFPPTAGAQDDARRVGRDS